MGNKQKRLKERRENVHWMARGKNEKGKRGKERAERQLGPTCNRKYCKKSKQRKFQYIGEASRELIFTKFWETLSWDQKPIYICSLAKQMHTKESVGKNSRTAVTFTYSLKTEAGFVYPVCKTMFLNTMDLGDISVLSWVKNGLSQSSDNILSERKVQNLNQRI